MAEFVPFHGLRYNTEKVNLTNVFVRLTMSLKARRAMNFYSATRITSSALNWPRVMAKMPRQSNTRKAPRSCKQWRDDGVLVRDDAAYYVYEQEFQVPGTGEIKKRRGVMGALGLEEFGKGVQPHEHTLSGPKQDRLNLLRALRTNTSPIFGLFGDDEGWVASVIDAITDGGAVNGSAKRRRHQRARLARD